MMSFDAIFWSAIGSVFSAITVAVFGYLQWKLSDRAEVARLRERAADDLGEMDTARTILRAQWFDLWSTVHVWTHGDMLKLARAGSLSPTDLALRDWTVFVTALGRTGLASIHLGTYALAMLRDAQKMVELFVDSVKIADEQRPEDPRAAVTFDLRNEPALRELASNALLGVTESVHLLEDMVDHLPGMTERRDVGFNASFKSETGKRLSAIALEKGLSLEDTKSMAKRQTEVRE